MAKGFFDWNVFSEHENNFTYSAKLLSTVLTKFAKCGSE
jgi:hypothetical protein